MRLNREILRLTLPAIVSNITMPLLGLCDTTVSGHLGSETYIGAIAVGTMMQNVVFWLFGFLRMGTTGLTAQAFGSNDKTDIRRIFTRSVALATFIGVVIILFHSQLRSLLLLLIGPEGEVRLYATDYFNVCIMGAPAMLVTMSIQGWLLGMQTTLLPMIVTISVNVMNMILSLLFSFTLGMGFIGVAYGTLTATWCGLILAILVAKRKSAGKRLLCGWRETFLSGGFARFFKVNGDIFMRSFCIIGVSMTVTAIGARLGSLTLAANAIIIQFYIFFSYCMDGFAFTGEALCGRFAGSGQRKLLSRSVRLLLRWSAVMAVAFTLTYMGGYREIIDFITDEASVRQVIGEYRIWIFLTPALSVMAFIFDGFFIGLTATRRMLVVTAIAATAFLSICFFHIVNGRLTIMLPDNNVMWGAFMTYLFLRGSLLAVQTPTVLRKAAQTDHDKLPD